MIPEPKLKVLLSLISPDIDYQLEQAAVAERLASKLGIAVNIEYADSDGVYQTLQILKVIQSEPALRPQAIVVEPVGTSMRQVAQAAALADIAWVVLNRDADYLTKLRGSASVPIFSVSTDNREVGRIQGKQMDALVPPAGCALYLEGPTNSDASRHRSHGLMAIKRPDIAVVRLRGAWTEPSGYHAVRSWLQLRTGKEAKISAVVCQNDAMAMGARRAFEELTDASMRKHFPSLHFTGCDGLPQRGETYVRRGLLKATVSNPPLTGIALEMLAQALRSRTQPPEETLVKPHSLPPVEEISAHPDSA